jgi:hypothetical protein
MSLFPFHYRWPTFHLEQAGPGRRNARWTRLYEGTLNDVGTDPVLVGKPTVLDVAGRSGERSLTLRASLDLSKKTAETSVRSLYSGVPLEGTSLGSVKGNAVSIAQGKGAVSADLMARGPALSGAIDLQRRPDPTDPVEPKIGPGFLGPGERAGRPIGSKNKIGRFRIDDQAPV